MTKKTNMETTHRTEGRNKTIRKKKSNNSLENKRLMLQRKCDHGWLVSLSERGIRCGA